MMTVGRMMTVGEGIARAVPSRLSSPLAPLVIARAACPREDGERATQ